MFKKLNIKIFGIIPFLKIKQKSDTDKYWLYMFGIPILKLNCFFTTTSNNDNILTTTSLLPLYDNPSDALIVELAPGHGEVLVGVVNYLLELGYSVSMLVSSENCCASGVFCRCDFPKDKIKRVLVSHSDICNAGSFSRLLSNYKFVFINTLDVGIGLDWNWWRIKYYNNSLKQNLMFIAHYISDVDGFPDDYYKNIFMLYDYKYKNGMCPNTLYPVFYGNVNTSHIKNKEVIFYAPGRLGRKVRDFDTIIEAARSLIKNKFINFKIIFTGRFDGNEDIKLLEYLKSTDVAEYFNIRGVVSYSEMYAICEECDFLITSLDINNPEHVKITHHHTSGNFGLCVGFQKPMLMGKLWTDFYNLTDKSIAYENNDLYSAMVRAINMEQTEYSQLQEKLGNYKESLYKKKFR
ncbi:MAG: hypothetical protein LBC92_01540 [Rickettsiales bacterium]|jgi:hypothetical protein|nr:hypothetical protein [Rickettsiales bacterium]